MSLPAHPLADLFPLIEGVEFEELVASIKAHGLWDPITLLDGAILDGRNRYRACQVAGVEPRLEDFRGDDPHAFVIAKNINRRHLNESQRAMIGAQIATRPHGGSKSEISDLTKPTVKQAAEMLNVSTDAITDARRVLHEGTKDEIDAVKAGKAAVTTIAREIRDKVPPEQRARTKREAGGNPARIEDQRLKAKVWADMRAVIDGISSLPRPNDCVAIARRFDRNGVVDARLIPAIEWLKEFSNEWSNRNGAADEKEQASGNHADAGTGNRAA